MKNIVQTFDLGRVKLFDELELGQDRQDENKLQLIVANLKQPLEAAKGGVKLNTQFLKVPP